ncbi:hypothetical protein HWQ46_21325 [Shewanella sp. D64]|uniref:hypothetical protein n=1 Tax=unclassified Shewanella TaxID=196818 RepID=UPI0022BA3279|nr:MULTISPECIES: hypothetical protein [unclassified Shewanella]MEC4728081.1 hypothetical protein [Shewanella sp. D64]MEC4738161.1 hypothetical protein [Shewanella sp. E94]WBJ96327.1 hypothetical protein HWQ47_04165 [Shewanella sp. MTB7]
MLRYLVLIPLLWLNTSMADVTRTQTEILTQRCLDTFDFIEKKDIETFIAQMPVTPSDFERKRAEKVLKRAHERWFIKEKIISIEPGRVTFSEPSKVKQEKYQAQEQAKIGLLIIGENYRSTMSCKFIKTPKGWFLSSLP